jgi:hypothetical protein
LSIEEVNKGLDNYLRNRNWGQLRVVRKFCGTGMMRKMLKVLHRPQLESHDAQVMQQQLADDLPPLNQVRTGVRISG